MWSVYTGLAHCLPGAAALALSCIVAQDCARGRAAPEAGARTVRSHLSSWASKVDSGNSDYSYQDQILPHVSRTFALTIPQLPLPLRVAVVNAYLLCRIADTIEDEPALSATETRMLMHRFAAVVAGSEAAGPLAREVAGRLSDRTLPAEREVGAHIARGGRGKA